MKKRRLSLRHTAAGIWHRILKPAFWNQVTLSAIQGSDNESFFSRFGWGGSTRGGVQDNRERLRLRFFFHPRNRKDFFLNTLTSVQPYEFILEEADHVLNNRFQTLGSSLIDLGDPIPWQRDFKSGKEWPLRKLSVEEIIDLKNPSDVKIPWELSRFHQVWWLGKASWLTGNPAYAEKFESLVSDWIAKNPVGQGVNWIVAMEASIRACNWIAGYYFFCESQTLKQDFWLRFFRSLLVHGMFIESHIEYSGINGNHFLSNVVGLLYLGIFFQDLPIGRRWLHWAIPQLEKAMQEQVYKDGVNHEHSTAYHRLVLEFFYSAALLCRHNTIRLSPEFWQKLERMFEYVQAYTRPDGSAPLVGDADDGRLFRFSMNQSINDHRHALSVGAILFRRPDFNRTAGSFEQESLWYFGGEGFEIHRTIGTDATPTGSHSFQQGGFYAMRSVNSHIFADAGEIGFRGRGGHGHNDTLSFELWHSAPFIVDSGTYTYTSDPAKRKLLQGTSSHNSVMVDDSEIADWKGLWSVKSDSTNPVVLEWSTNSDEDVLDAVHSGYLRLPDPVSHRRKFVFDKSKNALLITDILTGTQPHTLQLRFHFHPSVSLEREANNSYLALNGDARIRISCSEDAEVIGTLFSPSYGILRKSSGLQVRIRKALPYTISTRIILL